MRLPFRIALMATTASTVLFAGAATSQEAPAEANQVEDIVVVGANIRGARTTAALPVVVADREQMEATGATTGDELMRTIPQMGDVCSIPPTTPRPRTRRAAM